MNILFDKLLILIEKHEDRPGPFWEICSGNLKIELKSSFIALVVGNNIYKQGDRQQYSNAWGSLVQHLLLLIILCTTTITSLFI